MGVLVGVGTMNTGIVDVLENENEGFSRKLGVL